MPFHGHHRHTSSSSQHDHMVSPGGSAFGAIFHAVKGREHSPTKTASKAEPKNEGLGLLGLGSSSASASAAPNLSENIESPRRTHTYGREAEELHISSSNMSTSQQGSREPPRNHSFHTPSEFTSSAAPGISVHQATPQKNPHPTSVASSTLPGPLQSGRPGPPSINTTSSIVPTLPQTPGQPPRQPDFARASSGAQIHGYSRSSPAGLEQKYAPYINTPENSKYASTSSHKYTSQTPKADPSYSPLGLAEIRAHSESAMTDTPSSANPYSNNLPTNCNYLAPWAVYAFDWCKWPVQQQNSSDGAGKMAIGSYVEDGHNFVGLFPFDLTVGVFEGVCLNSVQIQILDTYITPEADVDRTPDAPQFGLDFVKTAEATHSYPVTRILWEPASSQKQSTDLLATSGDHLRLWSLPSQSSYAPNNSITRSSNNGQFPPQKLTPLALLSNSKSPEHTAPLTSLDWNNLSPSLIITSSIDTTCTIWDIPTLTAKTQLIAHDKEVFDVRFCANSVDVFVSCGADGSVRMFDLRSLEHSTIIYEPSEKNDKSSSPGNISPTTAQQTMSYAPPLLRLAASPHDAHLLATFSQDSNTIRILDVRQPGQALLELRGHAAAINCIEWSPSRRGTLASGGDDSLVLIWDLLNQGNAAGGAGINGSQNTPSAPNPDNSQGPTASCVCEYEVGNISWAPQSGLTSQGHDWLGVSGGRGVWGVCL